MKIALGADHAGVELKAEVMQLLDSMNIEYSDFGTDGSESVDYPDYAKPVAKSVAAGEYDLGILICGTGIGMSIAANKVHGVRCALVHDVFTAKVTREHNNSNVLAMGARVIGIDLAKMIVETWVSSEYEGGRHERRLQKLAEIEAEY
ncbi:ribose 5-phosphate isomerase B [Culicoidibacter larvae]|uniref:Ribose 5-phosphate isomerase B n=1 Tax=Culicoidibacter larvae TaxID=2579976 RepID=A0A5R8QDU1_9FIRM|nr:ribose 5-phosphate isomerase B [Culicoidibacter larvae]TLG73947.1 ribose 5-phosphate isomerase B [Culicoidibacter larvae]